MQRYCGGTQQIDKYVILRADELDNHVDNWNLHYPVYVDGGYVVDPENIEDREQLVIEKKYYIHLSVESDKRQKVILGFNAQHIHKYWLNGEIVYGREANSEEYTKYITVWLYEGENSLLMEMYQFYQNWRLMVMIYDYDLEMVEEINTLRGNHKKTQYDEPFFLRSPEWLPNEKEYRFIALLSDRDCYRAEYTYMVSYCTPDEEVLISEHQGIVGQIQTVDLNGFRQYVPHLLESMRHLLIRVRFQSNSNVVCERPLEIYPTDMVEVKCGLERELAEQIENMNSEQACWYRFCLTETFGHGFIGYHIYRRMMEYREILRQIHAHEELHIRKYFEPYQYVFHSDLDDRDIMLRVLTCNIGDKAEVKQLPLVLSISTNIYDNNCYSLSSDRIGEGVIHADVTVRGATGGSYVGEASFFEIFHWICQHYLVDLSRVYLIGFCNGAHAALHLAQSYPHMFAGMYILSGYPEMPLIHNLSNIPIYTVSSDADYVSSGVIQEMKTELEKYGNFYQFAIENITHDFIFNYMFPVSIIEKLLKHKSSQYPRQINFTTRCNRYLRSYWITINGIMAGKYVAHIQAEIESTNCIRIRCTGTEKITIDVPLEMSRKFKVILNGKTIIVNKTNKKIQLIVDSHLPQKHAMSEVVDVRKGSGLLDVYLNSLRIIISKDAGDEIYTIAKNLASPKTLTHMERILVSYPIYKVDYTIMPDMKHNLIIINRWDKNILINLLPIKCEENCCSYQENRWEGSYCVMQVISNPYNSDRSILCVTYNDAAYINRILFLRKMILPFSMNGKHQYLNNVALIWVNGEFHMTKEWNNTGLGNIEHISTHE